MQTKLKNDNRSAAVRETLEETLVDYLWKLVDDRDDNTSTHTFYISVGELFGMDILQVLHTQAGDTRSHKVFGVPSVECTVTVRRLQGEYYMEMGWEACAA